MVILFLLAKVVLFSESHSFYRSSHRRCSVKEGVLRNFAKIQENTCARASFLITLQVSATLLKKRLWHRCFPVNFAKFLRHLFSKNISGSCLFCFQQKWFLSMKNIPFSASICFPWRPQLIFSLNAHFFLPEATPFQCYLFLLVKSITFSREHTFQWKQLLLMKAISFSGMHSFYGR